MSDQLKRFTCNCRSSLKPEGMDAGFPEMHEPDCAYRVGQLAAIEIEHLRLIISIIAIKAAAGLCCFKAEGKQEFLRDISLKCEETGYDVLGDRIPESPSSLNDKEKTPESSVT